MIDGIDDGNIAVAFEVAFVLGYDVKDDLSDGLRECMHCGCRRRCIGFRE